MQSPLENLNAEGRFRCAFERLKAGEPKVLELGTLVSQNNVAREAGCDPSALKKARFPELVREIKAYCELHKKFQNSILKNTKGHRATNRSIQSRLEDALRQRDQAQSIMTSANIRIVELVEEVKSLQAQLEEIRHLPRWKTL